MASPLSPAAAPRTLVASVTSISRTRTRPPPSDAIRCSSFAVGGARQAAKTCQPSAAYWRANSRPRPRFAPVTRMVGIALALVPIIARDDARPPVQTGGLAERCLLLIGPARLLRLDAIHRKDRE